MNKEEKELLLRDLSARLPYGVKIHLETPGYDELIGTLDAVYPTEERVIVDNLDKTIAPINVRCGGFKIEENRVKPYLRPMLSMTEEEKKEYDNCYQRYDTTTATLLIDFYNKKMFDYRGLTLMGLALEAPKDMYDIK